MTATASATCDRALSGDAPDWVHLFPAGHMTGRDGREFDLADPQAIIAEQEVFDKLEELGRMGCRLSASSGLVDQRYRPPAAHRGRDGAPAHIPDEGAGDQAMTRKPADVAAQFPEPRRVRKSAIHAWWSRNRKPPTPQPQTAPRLPSEHCRTPPHSSA